MKKARNIKPQYAPKPLDILPTELAWLAGILDGEGSVCLFKDKSKRVSTLRVDVTVCNNCDDGILYEVLRLVPWVAVFTVAKKGKKSKLCPYAATQDCYALKITTLEGALIFLKAVVGFLKGAKRLRATAVIAYIQERLLHP